MHKQVTAAESSSKEIFNLLNQATPVEKETLTSSLYTLLWFSSKETSAFPYNQVVDIYHRVGKHFVPKFFLELLNIARKECRTKTTEEAKATLNFLNVMLDKYDNTYDYRSYLALDLLNMPDDEHFKDIHHLAQENIDHMTIQLTADLLKFEIASLESKNTHRKMLPEPALIEKRCRLALKACAPYAERLKLTFEKTQDSIQSSRHFIMAAESRMQDSDKATLMKTNIPVYLVHDEYMFIRILQTIEYTFSWISVLLRATIEAFKKNTTDIGMLLKKSQQHIKEATGYFHLLSSMRAESFKVFRQYTEGASAIQSRNYKRVESLCRQPDVDRINSIAYDSVPEIKEKITQNPLNLDDAFKQAKQEKKISSEDSSNIKRSMENFEIALKRWRQTHYGIAMKMLGQGTGTGYTEGTPYLDQVRNIPVFETTLNT